ncbi:MAG TPA: hypothetical protein PLL30_14390 [Candidatus Krumholzibacteria bacterium]|nr:hypothetical protein [Candidatus Krumholzibacteria bacterium]HPD72956.1 hypothetical protein [Candidatus Krumholzibacteria bacterium]HRY41755.1 hypothetical protein [Candidatus Krumholzibacteria bacterium]
MKRNILAILLVLGSLYTGPGLALVIEKDVTQLSNEADRIVVAAVADLESAWAPDGLTIYTDVTLQVEQDLKNSGASTITVRIPGGTVGDLSMVESDTPTFELGERVVAFLKTDDQKELMIWGWYQGKYSVIGDRAENDDPQLSRPLADLLETITTADH